jgi:hypothetical protein
MTKEILDGQLPGKIVNAKHRKSTCITDAGQLVDYDDLITGQKIPQSNPAAQPFVILCALCGE